MIRINVDDILAILAAKVEACPVAHKIGLFDHYAHTKSLPEGEVAKNIHAAKHIIFCFGIKLPDPLAHTDEPKPDFCSLKIQFTHRFWQKSARFPLIRCFSKHKGEHIPQHLADSVMSPAKSDIYVGA